MRATLVILCAAAAALGAGCGGNGDDDVKNAAEPAVVREAAEDLRGILAPRWADVAVTQPTVASMTVVEQREGRRVSGTVRAQLKLTPKPDKAAFLRVLDATGATSTVTRGFTADLFKGDDDRWQVVGDSVRIQAAPRRTLTPTESEQARTLAIDAVRALLKWPGNLNAYNRAQRPFYATRLATEADFNQPGFDPAPALILRSKRTRRARGFGGDDVSVGAAWERTNDNAQDDQPLVDVLRDLRLSCERFVMKVLNPKTVSAEPDQTQDLDSGELVQTARFRGQAVVRAGVWQNTSPYSNCGRAFTGGSGRTVTAAPRDMTVTYTANVSRLLIGPRRSWFRGL